MSDEMLYVKLGTAIADSWSPLPRLHGTSVGVINQLYPLLLAPFFGPLSVPAAFHDAHIFNAVLMASACIPADRISSLDIFVMFIGFIVPATSSIRRDRRARP